jgi:hypothetical protein
LSKWTDDDDDDDDDDDNDDDDVMIDIYVDDCLVVRKKEQIQNYQLLESKWLQLEDRRISHGILELLCYWEYWYEKNFDIAAKLNQQFGVTLSSTDAEHVAISKRVKLIKLVNWFLWDIAIKVNLPIIVNTDNVGAMFMVPNAPSSVRTCHIDTWYPIVTENLEEGSVKIEWVKSVKNESDIFTKNITQEIYKKQV